MRQSALLVTFLIACPMASAQQAEAPTTPKPLTKDERLTYAKSLELSGQRAKAEAALAKLHQDFPADAQVLKELAQIRVALKHFKPAAAAYAKLAKLQPENREWALMRAKTLAWAGDHQAAYAALAHMDKRWPNDAQIARLRADAALGLHKHREAVAIYNKLLAQTPHHRTLRAHAAQAAEACGLHADAERHYRWLADNGHADSAARLALGRVLNAQGKFADAARVLRNLHTPDALRARLDAQVGLQDFAGARTTCRKLLKTQPDDARLAMLEADLSLWMKDFAAAAALYEKRLDAEPDNADVRAKLADALHCAQQHKAAAEHYEVLLAAKPQDETLRRRLADCCMAAQDFAKAAAQWQALHDAHPDDIELEASLAMALYLDKRLDDAAKHLDALVAKNPNDVKAVRLLADVLMEQQRYDQAIAMYRKAIKLGDHRRDTRLRVARVLSWNKQYDEAVAAYGALIAEDPTDWQTWREKPRILGWDREYGKAVAEYQRVAKAHPGNERVASEAKAKTAYYIAHDRTAIDHYTKLLSIESDNLEAHFDLAQVYSRQSMWGQAENQYKQTLALYPGHHRAAQALDKVQAITTRTHVRPHFFWNRRKSSERATDVNERAFGLSLSRWLGRKMRVDFIHEYEHFDFAHHHGIPANFYKLAGRYFAHPLWDAGLHLGVRDFVNTEREHYHVGGDVRLRLFDAADLKLFAQHRDFIENYRTLTRGTERNDFGAKVNWRVTRRLRLGADWMYSDFSHNDNHKYTLGAEAVYRILWEPTRLDVGYRFENWNYHRKKPEYFSPSKFQMHTLMIDWRHYLNRHELFWGAKDTYYDLGYSFTFDSQREHAHTVRVGIHHDFSSRCTAGVDYSITRGTAYDEDRLMVSLSYGF